MRVVDDKKRAETNGLRNEFRNLAGAVFGYRDQVLAGNIEPSGQAKNAAAKQAETNLLKAASAWRTQTERLGNVIAWLAVAPEPTIV